MRHPARGRADRRGGARQSRQLEGLGAERHRVVQSAVPHADRHLPAAVRPDQLHSGLLGTKITKGFSLHEGHEEAQHTREQSRARSNPGDVWDAAEPAQQEAEWQVRLKQAAGLAAMMGRVPSHVVTAVEEAAQPRVDWRSILRRFVQQFASSDYSWRRPNRRCVASGVYIPELHADSMPALVVVADTSGSTRDVLDVFVAELRSIQEECRPEETILIMADAAVHRVDRFARDEPITCQFVGMGGTDFRPAFEYIEAEQISPACLIYLTDGHGTYPETPSEFPTLWAITTPDLQAPWGETVTIDPTMTS